MAIGRWALASLLVVSAWGATAGEIPSLIPAPVSVEAREGSFTITGTTRLVCSGKGAAETAETLAGLLAPAMGSGLKVTRWDSATGNILLTTRGADAAWGPEGYELTVSKEGIVIRATTSAGLFYGCQTLRQLLPPAVLAGTRQEGVAWTVPAVHIRDQPRYRWRGLMLDVCRHFLSADKVKKFIDVMALHKFNSLHWHLTEDQAWRIEIKKYPRLTEVGSVRAQSPMHGNRNKGDGVPYGPFFYTQAQIREVVAYAAARHIVIVPEIEMPGHALAALSAYPEFSCRGGPFKPRTWWGVEDDVYCAGNDKTVAFVKDILTEVMSLFPGPFIHIGGDECPKGRWANCPKCQARMKAEGLKSTHELQSWFVRRMDQFLASRGRRLIGWDEILEGGLAPGAAVMCWRGVGGGIAAAQQGHDVVMSPGSHCYLDHGQSGMPGEPECIGGRTTLARAYSYEPTPAELTAEQKAHVLGVQGNLWSEYLWNAKDVEFAAFPRACALAEVAWTPAAKKNFADFWTRMESHVRRLEILNVNYRRLTPDQK